MSPTAKQPVILIVEDQAVMRSALREFLLAAFPGCDILEAANGSDALKQCLRHGPRLVLMDVCLPDANGIELTGRLKALMREVSVIVVSWLCGSEYSERARAAGAAGYVVKDQLATQLVPAVAGALGIAPAGKRRAP